jgi:hypothetical protein
MATRIASVERGAEPHRVPLVQRGARRLLPAFTGGGRAMKVPISLILVLAFATQSHARWKPEYENQPAEVQEWYRNAEVTEAAQQRFPFKKCCDNADVVRTKFNVNRTNAGDEWFWLDGETWRRIPDDIIHWDKRAPNGQPTLFVYSGKETCFFPGDGGI